MPTPTRRDSRGCVPWRWEHRRVSSGGESRAGSVRVRYRRDDGQIADTTLDRVPVDDVMAGLPVREFRSYKGRQHYSGFPPVL